MGSAKLARLLLVMRCAWAFVGRRQIAATPRRSLRRASGAPPRR